MSANVSSQIALNPAEGVLLAQLVPQEAAPHPVVAVPAAGVPLEEEAPAEVAEAATK